MSVLGDKLKKMFLAGQGIETQSAGNYNPGIGYANNVHKGTDIGVNVGTPITLPQGNWKVEQSYGGDTTNGSLGDWTNGGYGNSVVVRDQNSGETYKFSHLLRPLVQAGQVLTGGQIGLSGSTGNVTGPHVDIETYGQGMGNAFANAVNNASAGKPQVNVASILAKARAQYGNKVLGVSNDPKLLARFANDKRFRII